MSHDAEHDALEQLTPREQEVIELLRLGLPDAEIAGRLDVSAAAIGRHVSQIIAKLGVRNRYAAAAWPEHPPWWTTALAPMALFWRKAGAALPVQPSSLATVLSGGLFAAALGGLGLMAFLLLRGGDVGATIDETTAADAPASRVLSLPPDLSALAAPGSLSPPATTTTPSTPAPTSTPEPAPPPTTTPTAMLLPPAPAPTATSTPTVLPLAPAPTPVPTATPQPTPVPTASPSPTSQLDGACGEIVISDAGGDLQDEFPTMVPDQAATVDGDVAACTRDVWSFITCCPPYDTSIGVSVILQTGAVSITVFPPVGSPVSLEPGEEYRLSYSYPFSSTNLVAEVAITGELPDGGSYRLMVCRSLYDPCTFSTGLTTP